MHEADVGDALLLFDGNDDGGIEGLEEPIGHRAIGVVYDPRREAWGNYVPTIVPRRYDAFMYIEETAWRRCPAHARAGGRRASGDVPVRDVSITPLLLFELMTDKPIADDRLLTTGHDFS